MNIINSLLIFETPVNKTFSFFGLFDIYYYGVCIVLGLILSTFITALIMHRRNVSVDVVLLAFMFCVPSAIIGTRLFAVISDGIPVSNWLDIRDGGLSIMGGIIGGATGAILLCLVKKYNFFRIADCIAPTFPLAQAIGRWGNYFNQEVYGRVVTDPSLQFFPFSVFIEKDQSWHYAFFFYESLANLIWSILLIILAWNLIKKPNGIITCLFFSFYGLLRAVMEPLRDPIYQYGSGDGVDSSLVMAYILIAVGIGMIAFLLIRNKRKYGKFFGSANTENEYIVTTFVPSDKEDLPVYSKLNAASKLLKKGVFSATEIQTENLQ